MHSKYMFSALSRNSPCINFLQPERQDRNLNSLPTRQSANQPKDSSPCYAALTSLTTLTVGAYAVWERGAARRAREVYKKTWKAFKDGFMNGFLLPCCCTSTSSRLPACPTCYNTNPLLQVTRYKVYPTGIFFLSEAASRASKGRRTLHQDNIYLLSKFRGAYSSSTVDEFPKHSKICHHSVVLVACSIRHIYQGTN